MTQSHWPGLVAWLIKQPGLHLKPIKFIIHQLINLRGVLAKLLHSY